MAPWNIRNQIKWKEKNIMQVLLWAKKAPEVVGLFLQRFGWRARVAVLTSKARLIVWSSAMVGLILAPSKQRLRSLVFSLDFFFFFPQHKAGEVRTLTYLYVTQTLTLLIE